MQKLTIGVVIAVLTSIVVITLILVWAVIPARSTRVPREPKLSTALQNKGVPWPSKWKRIEVGGKIILYIPQDMRPSQVSGDSLSDREAFSNSDVRINIIYGESDSCATPTYLMERSTYHESVVEIDGRKATLGVDHYYQPRFILAYLCFPSKADNTAQLRVSAVCKHSQALETAQQIFTTIKLKDER